MNTRSCGKLSLSFTIFLLLASTVGHAAQTTLASLDIVGGQGDFDSSYPDISADGRYVVFVSEASNLVPGDTNGSSDVFIRDRIAGTTRCVSVSSAGVLGDGASFEGELSANGRYVAFVSAASNLVPGDTNGQLDIFVRDLQTLQTTRVSVDSAGAEGDLDSGSWDCNISPDGRFVVFGSAATNLVPGDANGMADCFIHDRSDGTTSLVSVDSAGGQGNGPSTYPSLSSDGNIVVFGSGADNLVPGDTNASFDVFYRDRKAGTTTRISLDSAGVEADDSSYHAYISADNGHVVFVSPATNLVPGDTNGQPDIFLRHLKAGTTSRVSVNSAGEEGNGDSGNWDAYISADGRYVVFSSAATNLVPGDTNGFVDVFLRDLNTGETTRVSVDSSGKEADGISTEAVVSPDGRYVVFESFATNLVSGDTNGFGDVMVRDRLLTTKSQADVALAVTTAPVSVAKGGSGSYTFTITNNGGSEAKNTAWVDVASSAPSSVVPSKGFCAKSVVSVCRIGTLAPGESATVNVVIKAVGRKATIQQLSVSASPVDPVPENNYTAISTPTTK